MEEHTKLVLEILTPLIIMMGWMWKNLGKKIDGVEEKLEKKIDGNTTAIKDLDRRIQRIEDRLEFSNKVVYVQHEEIKENGV
jgi:tetrahydromethanopterin S-methyltransferase subunit G